MDQTNDALPDEILVVQSLQGDRKSLEGLVGRHYRFIYNVVLKMLSNKEDAADITQEVVIKLITKLDSFKHNSAFRTWLYKIIVNHVLNYRKSQSMKKRYTFRQFGEILDGAPDMEFSADDHYAADQVLLVEETKQTCMSGMLLCLDKKHRLVFILGELFGVNDKVGSEILGISPENFRMILSRAKRDLYTFMQGKCGLINKNNPCRCAKKTKAFIEAGFVNPDSLRFTGAHRQKIESVAGQRQGELEDLLYYEYRDLYLQHTYLEAPDLARSLQALLASEKIAQLFNLT